MITPPNTLRFLFPARATAAPSTGTGVCRQPLATTASASALTVPQFRASARPLTTAAASRTSRRRPESTSFSTPQVAGAAAVLMQAGLRGDGGSDTNAAADIRTVKALLFNGAVKPADWTNIAAFAAGLPLRRGGAESFSIPTNSLRAASRVTSLRSASPPAARILPTGATGTGRRVERLGFQHHHQQRHHRRRETIIISTPPTL